MEQLESKQALPNATATLVLGICSLVFGCFLIGLVLGIIGLSISASSKRLYHQNPAIYSGYGVLNAGRITSLIGLILGAIAVLWFIIAALIVGSASLPWLKLLNS